MLKNSLTGLDKKKLRHWILLFFFSLAIPTAILIQQSYSRLKWETFHQHQLMADELATRIDGQFLRLIKTEEERSFTDYSFLNIAGDSKANMLQRSPLSKFPVESKIAGLIGFFQVNTEGKLMTPLLPDAIKAGKSGGSYGISDKELALRTTLENIIQDILSQNRLVKKISTSKTTLVKKKKVKDSFFGRLMGSSRSESKDGSNSKKGMIYNDHNKPIADNFYTESITVESAEADSDTTIATSDSPNITVNEIVVMDDSEQPNPQIAFDRLKEKAPAQIIQNKLGRVEDLKLKKRYKNQDSDYNNTKGVNSKKAQSKVSKQIRIEQNILPESEAIAAKTSNNLRSRLESKKADQSFFKKQNKQNLTDGGISKNESTAENPEKQSQRIRTFESVIDSFEFSLLDSGHLVLFRKVWLNDQRYIQGLLIEQKPFLEQVVNTSFRETALSQMSHLLLSYQGNVLSAFSGNSSRSSLSKNKELSGELLYQTRLSDPFGDLQLIFSITQLPIGAGGKVILWLTLILSIVLCAGFYLMYRLGLGQINLANQQQDFVSAVSHELKTPLTSIRMYGEILREGWASEEKKKTYYDFIYNESERLSRLINNVLHLARVTRNKQSAEFKHISVSALMDEVQSKISTQVKHAGFELIINGELVDAEITIDADWFAQIIINLVDNAIKFSAKSKQKKIELVCLPLKNNKIVFSVRDYGPGVDKAHMKKIFKLFYRTESELTRETVGTGIGLALVHQMVVSMGGEIDVLNRKPGAEFRISFKEKNS